jgi:glycine/D-amino acid oxidase-like deaminating enzyme
MLRPQKPHACRVADLGAQHSGSLLLATSATGVADLQHQAAALANAGLESQFLSAAEAMDMEPLLELVPDAGALYRSKDWQICARSASEYLLRQCEDLGEGTRFAVHFGIHVERVSMDCCKTEVTGVRAKEGYFGCRWAPHVAVAWQFAHKGGVGASRLQLHAGAFGLSLVIPVGGCRQNSPQTD